MGEAFIVKHGGMGKAFAAIAVTYPVGSVCTCTKGTKALTAKDTSGEYLFFIPEAGTWTVSCTDGTKTTSKTVVIDRQYQAESIELAYMLILFENGTLNPAYSISGFTIFNNELYIQEYAAYANKTGVITPAIDLSSYSTLHITGYKQWASAAYNQLCGLSTTTTGYNQDYIASVTLDLSSSTKTVDISSLTTSAYFKAGVANGEVHLSKIWLD